MPAQSHAVVHRDPPASTRAREQAHGDRAGVNNGAAAAILSLQRHAGNAAVQRWLGVTALAKPMVQAKQCVDGWFTKLQNRPIAAGVNELEPHWYPSGKFGTSIELDAKFEPLAGEVNCHKGEYRQFVRSNRKVNDKELKAPGNIDGKTFHEDKVPTKIPTGKGKETHTYRAGHRKDQLSKFDDKATVYSPNVLGCNYHVSDFAHVGDIKKDDKVEVRDEFIGQLIDLCTDGLNPDQDTPYDAKQTLDQVEWKIEGTLTIGPDGFAVITKPDEA